MSLLKVQGLSASYGGVEVVHDIDLDVAQGEIVVVLGANGAGKSTVINAISGTIDRTGRIDFRDNDIVGASSDAIVRAGIAQVPEGRGTFSDLTVEENLRVGAFTGASKNVGDDIQEWYQTFPILARRRTQKAGLLSGGEQQMLAIARALMGRPRLLLCDEPSQGLAPLVTKEMLQVIARLRDERGIGVLLVEQNANLAMTMADRVYVLETGRIVAEGDPQTLANDESVRRAYLGY